MSVQKIQTKTEVSTLAEALCRAQKKIKSAEKDSVNPHFKNKYASLSAVWDACKDALNDEGISVVQTFGTHDNGQHFLKTQLLHTSGETIESLCPLIMTKSDMQALGSCASYARRYSIASMVGVVQDDDDGNAASEPTKQIIQTKQTNSGEYIIDLGPKNRTTGMTLEQAGEVEVQNNYNFWAPKKPDGKPGEFVKHAKVWLEARRAMKGHKDFENPPIDSYSDVPF